MAPPAAAGEPSNVSVTAGQKLTEYANSCWQRGILATLKIRTIS